MIQNKFIYFKTKSNFAAELNNISLQSIVFIEDSREIYTHGIFFNIDTSNYYTITDVNNLLENKVNKIVGKELSTNDYTDAEKSKLAGLVNYDDSFIRDAVSSLQNQFDILVNGNVSETIDNYTEIINFLENIKDSETLEEIIAAIQASVPTKVSELQNDSNFIQGSLLTNVVVLTLSEYDALTNKSATTLYITT